MSKKRRLTTESHIELLSGLVSLAVKLVDNLDDKFLLHVFVGTSMILKKYQLRSRIFFELNNLKIDVDFFPNLNFALSSIGKTPVFIKVQFDLTDYVSIESMEDWIQFVLKLDPLASPIFMGLANRLLQKTTSALIIAHVAVEEPEIILEGNSSTIRSKSVAKVFRNK